MLATDWALGTIWSQCAVTPWGDRVVHRVAKKDGGAEESRTPYLLNAIQALYQVSYSPILGSCGPDSCRGGREGQEGMEATTPKWDLSHVPARSYAPGCSFSYILSGVSSHPRGVAEVRCESSAGPPL